MTPATDTLDATLNAAHATAVRIQADIDNITYLPAAMARASSMEITHTIARLEMTTITQEQFGPFTEQAVMARDTTISALMELREGMRKRERVDLDPPRDVAAEAEQVKRHAQQQNANRTIQAMQDMEKANGSAGALRLIIDSVAATSIQEDEYGDGVEAVKQAQQDALDALRPKYEQAVIHEGVQKLHDIADELIEESDASDAEIILAVAHHFGWSREKAMNRMICIDYARVKP